MFVCICVWHKFRKQIRKNYRREQTSNVVNTRRICPTFIDFARNSSSDNSIRIDASYTQDILERPLNGPIFTCIVT